jgi:hypothetical protein
MSKRENGDRFNVVLETVPAQVTRSEPNIAYSIAEFMLNLLPITNPLPRSDVAAYVEPDRGPPLALRFTIKGRVEN